MIKLLVRQFAPNFIRYAGTATGTVLINNGLADGSTATQVSGALVVILTFAWSLIEKKGLLNQL